MRMVPINSAREGCYLAKTIFDNDGRILLREGVLLTDTLIKKVKSIKIYTIYIHDEYSSNEIEDIIEPQVRQFAVKTIRQTFFSIGKNLSKPVDDFKQKKFNRERHEYFKSMSLISKDIVDEILSKKDILLNLVDIKSIDNYTYQHSVNVAVISLILGIQMKLPKDELYMLCLGAMLHDIGKVFIPKDIILKRGTLTSLEFNTIKEHTSKGYDYLKISMDIPATSRIIALQHHEKINGRGYPDGRNGCEINKFSKIVAIADVYDALTSDRPYRTAMCPNEAIEFIMANGDTHFDYDIVKEFSKIVIPYPEGSLVRLSNGDIALIEEINPNFPLRPKVKIIKSETNVGEHFDLLNKLDIVINSIEFEVE